MLLNFHTHNRSNHQNFREIYNIIVPQEIEELENFEGDFDDKSWLSVGIHPWYISTENNKEQLEFLMKKADYQEVKLIGECGLDRLKGANLKLQEEVFIQQIHIAEDVRKPIVIHCVKCFSELISIKKIIRPRVPMIVHGFNQNEQIATQLLEKEFYLSIGTAILQENSNAQKIIKNIPLDRLFLETDNKEISIKSIYTKCAELLEIASEALEELIFENYLKLSI